MSRGGALAVAERVAVEVALFLGLPTAGSTETNQTIK